MSTALQQRLATMSAAERAALLALVKKEATPPPPRHDPKRFPLCDMQRVMWNAQALAPSSSAYNVGFALKLSSPYDVALLRRAARAVTARHAALRAVYRVDDVAPVQVIGDATEVEIEDREVPGLDEAAALAYARASYERPFDLARGPAMRLAQFRLAGGGAVLLLAAHHLTLDLWSITLVLEDLRAAYEAERTGRTPRFEPVDKEYGDFVAHQQQLVASPEGERLWQFWRQELEGVSPTLDLPTDRAHPPLQGLRGASLPFAFSPELTNALRRLSQSEGKTAYVTLLSALQALLHRYSGARDFVIGSPVSYRPHDLARTVGCMINFLPLRARIGRDATFRSLLDRAFGTVLSALEHQAYPFGVMTNRLRLPRSHSRPLLAQVGMSFESPHLHDRANDTLFPKATPLPFLAQQEGQFDLYWEFVEIAGRVHGALRYNTEIFDDSTAQKMAADFERVVTAVAKHPDIRLSDLPVQLSRAPATDTATQTPAAADHARSLAIQAWWRFRRAHTEHTAHTAHGAAPPMPKDANLGIAE